VALGPDGTLARRKVFTRADVFVAVAPSLFGRAPTELARVVDAVVASPEAIPLIGVAAARERAYAPACVLAREAAIAANVAGMAARTDAPAVSRADVEAAIAAKERALGRALTAGQSRAVVAIATSGRGAESVLGVAGAGKTTAVDVVRAAFESAGYRVLGTSTSGQAARTLGREAGMESRTMASLLWRLDHGRARLDERTVVICDEAGMADDPSMLRLLAAAEAARAKVVLVGDHRQLGAVGPGGTFEAVLARHPDAVHTLDENVRQVDPAERAALVELRAGDVDAALAFYAERDRIRAAPTRDEALDAMVERWAGDIEAGADTAMFAWRRANVVELNARGRQAMAGRLAGPELAVSGRAFQAGDRIVTLAPGANGELVTSERGVVDTVLVDEHAFIARMDDGRRQVFAGEDLAADHLAHGYAVTVHRSQGATVDTTHLFADGGGRELGYVAMSRARGTSHAYVVADDVETAVEDLARDWSAERRALWAIDSGTPATRALDVEADTAAPAPMRAALARARLVAEREAVAAAVPADPHMALGRANGELARLRESRFDLECGRGTWAGTAAGEAARELMVSQAQGRQAAELAARADVGWRMRRSWRAEAAAWAAREHEATARFAEVAGPHLEHLKDAIAAAQGRTAKARFDVDAWDRWQSEHPEAGRRLAGLDADIARLDRQLAREVDLKPAVGWDLRRIDLDVGHRPPTPEPPSRGLGLGL
ncbi:MAG: ATP-dependent DNA helicase, partial [Acidimicrobiales bacterium]